MSIRRWLRRWFGEPRTPNFGDVSRGFDDVRDTGFGGVWTPEYELSHELVIGHLWPLVVVTKWEVNRRGERRFVGSRIYGPPQPEFRDTGSGDRDAGVDALVDRP